MVEQLNRINQEFYTRFATPFAASRSLSQPSLQRMLAYVPAGGRVLDVGCGNGRVAHLLDRHRPEASYLGLDSSAALVGLARAACAQLVNVTTEFQTADLTRPNWWRPLARRKFDAIFLLAVLHHIPAYANRLAILRVLRTQLVAGGRMVVSAWQFTSNERMRRKIVSWDHAGIDPAVVEPGDYLLDWKRGGLGYRYCHLIDHDELSLLALDSGLRLVETYRADGKEGDLSLFGVLAEPQV